MVGDGTTEITDGSFEVKAMPNVATLLPKR
jgi:hypothetical protein